jgi:prepilin-type N-terminal cleavage/methylation domain-containing protein
MILLKFNKKRKKAFTLVELIVVITILAILWTIAFISFAWYSKNSRDSVRLSDMNNIEKNLWIFIVEKWYYPNPDNWTRITYEWAIAWTQWTVWDTVIRNLWNINKKPLDPLTNTEYTYSVTNKKVEYQIWSIIETSWWISYNNIPLLTEQTYAAEKKALAKIRWTYNEKILKVSTWWIEYILAVPTIINANLEHTDIQTIIDNKELVYNNYSNLPDSYKNLWYTMTWWFDYNPSNLIVFSWSEITLKEDEDKLLFLDNLKNAYNWTIIQGEEAYKDILKSDIDSNEKWAIILVNNYIQNNVWWIKWKLSTVTYNNCTIDWQTINHLQTITTYSENTILFNASYDCIEKSQERTCNDWVLSWEDTYIYTSCIKWTPTNCSASWSYSYNWHTYSIPIVNHSETASGIVSNNVNQNNWVFNYTLTNIECNDWALINETESDATLVSCNLNYSESGNLCIADTKTVSCTWKPTGSVYNTATDITQTWDWNNWLPNTESTYNTDASTSECRYKCDTNYTRDWSSCLEVINWVCWTSNLQNLSVEPTTWLCTSWDASSVSWTWPWSWTCDWINWWTSQNCNTTSYCSVWWIWIWCIIP